MVTIETVKTTHKKDDIFFRGAEGCKGLENLAVDYYLILYTSTADGGGVRQ